MKKREKILSMMILALFVLATLCMVKISHIGRQLSELEVARQRPCNVWVLATCVSILPLRESQTNMTIANMRQNRLQVHSQLDLSTDSEDSATPEACASQWLHDVITVEETLGCIEDYMKNK